MRLHKHSIEQELPITGLTVVLVATLGIMSGLAQYQTLRLRRQLSGRVAA